MQWHEMAYYRRMEMTLWAELDKAGVILEPGQLVPKKKQADFARAVRRFQRQYTWACGSITAEVLGLERRYVEQLLSRQQYQL